MNKHSLAKILVMISIMVSSNVYALGIGDIALHSALNQNLNAEISLFATPNEVSTIKVKLALPDKFDELGVPWSPFLANIKFKTLTKSDGSMFIKLSSSKILSEPFLNFLLEVSWDNGRLYREFVVLVDPPREYTRPISPAIQPTHPVTQQTNNRSKPIATITDIADNDASTAQYIAVNVGDSLWGIAKKTNTYDKSSTKQMMLSIYNANPKAFYKNNINALMAGKTLKIPSKDTVLKLSKEEASIEFKRQNNAWNNKDIAKPQNKSISTKSSGQLKLEPPTIKTAQKTVTPTDANIKFNPDVADTNIQTAKVDALATESDASNIALLTRVKKLETQLLDMQKMIILKDRLLETLQNQQTNLTPAPLSKPSTIPNDAQVTEDKADNKTTQTITSPINKIILNLNLMAKDITSKIPTFVLALMILVLILLWWPYRRQIKSQAKARTTIRETEVSKISPSNTTNVTGVNLDIPNKKDETSKEKDETSKGFNFFTNDTDNGATAKPKPDKP